MIHRRPGKRFFWTGLFVCFLLSGLQISVSSAQDSREVIINELMAANGAGLIDEDGETSDWIEIYNASGSSISLAGWALTDDPAQPQKWPFPALTLSGQQYLVVFASGKNRKPTTPGSELHANFKLSKDGDFLGLYNVLEGRFIDQLSPRFPQQFRDVAYGRYGPQLAFGYLAWPTPGQPNEDAESWSGAVAPVVFSPERGIYQTPLAIRLSTDTPDAVIRYTLDGSEPTLTGGIVYTEPVTITTTTLLRAAAFKPGHLPSVVAAQTYIFPGSAAAPGAVPADQSVSGFLSAPTLSLGLEPRVLHGLLTGRQNNHKEAEQPVSVELFYPMGEQPGFQANAGLRPYGSVTPQNAFRLFFRAKYGTPRLNYPLFPDSSVESFNTLILQPITPAYLGQEWLRDSQLAMAGLGAHSLPVHLFLNGRYQGLYHLVERPDEAFMAAYLGGKEEDWFVATQAGPLNEQSADPFSDLFTLLPLAERMEDRLASESTAGIVEAAASALDPAQLIDYMILSWYAHLLGWPDGAWYAAIRPADLPGQGKLLLGEDPGGSGRRSGDNTVQRLFEAAMQDADARLQFADRLYRHLFNNGPLADTNAQARWLSVYESVAAATITSAIEGEETGQVSTLNGDGRTNLGEEILFRMDNNAARLIDLAREAGYYPDIDPPLFSHTGGQVETGFRLQMTLPAGACRDCIIYYTTTGSDPRLPVTGTVSPEALIYKTPLVLTAATHLKARVWTGAAATPEATWSALSEANFYVVEQDDKLRITEIMYHPVDGDDHEFIELRNMGQREIDMGGISLVEGARFIFPPNSPPLAPGEFLVLVSNPAAFAGRYPGVTVSGAYEGHLSNKGERVTLEDTAGRVLISFEYDDQNGWPISADGRGDSLVLIKPDGDPGDPRNWRASAHPLGSPGADDGF